jgi:HEAT repeat protein
MRVRTGLLLLLCLLAFGGCSRQKSTDELITDLKGTQERDRIVAVRLLPQHKGDAARVVPALTEALKDKDGDIRWSAAIGLGYFGDQARDAVPALQAAQRDRDARVREAAGVALSRIDPDRFRAPPGSRGK